MAELLPTRVFSELRRTTLALACMLPLGGLPAGVLAQDVPAGLRACAAESDPGQRLDCYDREMKHLLARRAPSVKSVPPAAQPAAAEPDLSSSSAKSATDAAASTPPAAAAVPGEPAAPHPAAAWKKFFSGGTRSQLTGHVVSLERSPNAMVIHLDNGQVWHQVGRASGALTLHAGDKVTIEKRLGSYWLSARYISDMQVRQGPR